MTDQTASDQTASMSAAMPVRQTRRFTHNATARALLALSAAGWLALAFLAQTGNGLALCLSAPANLVDGFLSGLSAQLFQVSPGLLAAEWGLMALAMMLPLAIPHLTIFCARLYRNMQRPALVAAICGFTLAWLALGLFVVPLMLALRSVAFVEGLGWLVPSLTYGAAILWSYAPVRQSALRRCHAVPVLYGSGRDVYRSAFGYGLRLGGICSVTCGLAMAAPMLSGQGILAMALVTHILLKERLSHRPTAVQTALPLALIGLMALV